MISNKNCIIRLSRYKNALHRLKSLGFVKVFSDNLADAVGATPAQVRKDFSLFGISGNRRGGYIIDELLERINNILGKNEIHKVIIVGAGNIGTALVKYKGFEKEGIKILAVFDVNPSRINNAGEIPVLPVEMLSDFVVKNNVAVGVIAVPDVAAQGVLDTLVAAGVKGVLNFAPMRLRGPEEVVINNVNIELELENVIYYANVLHKEK